MGESLVDRETELEALSERALAGRNTVDQLPHPTTTEPRRASRDAAGWRALATLGHPDLQERIDTIAAANPSASLQIGESGVSAAAARADRSPPQLVDRLEDLVDLQEAVAVEDAQDLAAATAQAQDRAYQEELRRWDTHRRQRERRALLAELTERIHHMLALESVASGDAPAEELWSSLIARRTPKLCGSLPRLLKEAGLATNDVLASYGPEQFEVGNADGELLKEARHLKSWWKQWSAAS